ncbi:hypothetical protein BJ508DRAFT_195117, partial [Ascobolus immersus RN42]
RIHPVFNVSSLRLRPPTPPNAIPRQHHKPPPPLRINRGAPEHEIERIVAHHRFPGPGRPTYSFQIRWRDHDTTEDEWFSYGDLIDSAPRLLKEYYLAHS